MKLIRIKMPHFEIGHVLIFVREAFPMVGERYSAFQSCSGVYLEGVSKLFNVCH